MALSLEQYAASLDSRDLTWPIPAEPKRIKAKPFLVAMPSVRMVTWNIYGTLLNISGGEFHFEYPEKFIMELALEKTIQEFNMWNSMSRKPGKPSEYLGQIYKKVVTELRMVSSPGERFPEILSEKIWENIFRKLEQREYRYDVGKMGNMDEFCKKIAYFFHASLQGTMCYPGAAVALEHVKSCGLSQGFAADGQCFTLIQLQRALDRQVPGTRLDSLVDADVRGLSCDIQGRKPSERLFKPILEAALRQGLRAQQILHIGSRMNFDLVPARKLGMRTALFAGDKASFEGTAEQVKDASTRPDVLLTDLEQIQEIIKPV